MTKITEYLPNSFCWVELNTSNADSAKQFYTKLFGWTAHDNPVGPDMVYTMLQLDGQNVAALYQQNTQQQAQDMSPDWLVYISVADIEATVAKTIALGGSVLAGPAEVMDAGWMAHLQDPEGTMFAIWQPKAHIGAQVITEPGSMCWHELATRDHKNISQFYADLFSWGTKVEETDVTIYTTFLSGETMVGGMLQMTAEWDGLPSHWTTYFAVEDCDACAKRAKQLGGTVAVPPTDIGVGRFAVIQDLEGGTFCIIKLAGGYQMESQSS